MTNDTIDLLQIKIEKAKSELPVETVNAIAAVDWKEAILGMRTKKGYTFEQLGDLELETELALCGLLNPQDYPHELEKRMGISKVAANELVDEMNNSVFKKVREELIKNIERKKGFTKKPEGVPPILMQKLTTLVQNPITKTDHTLDNLIKNPDTPAKTVSSSYPPKADPYRLSPE